jgi:ABC-type multidrug transport system ATPase subunit
MSGPAIRIERLSKSYRRKPALANVSVDVPRGVVFALLGENGAGKTTAIRIMLGLTEPDTGRAEVLGLDCRTRGQEIRRAVGYVPERTTLYEWMTVDEIGWFTAGFYGNGFLPKYRGLTEAFELPQQRKIKELSKGMRAKVALSLAMGHQPDLLILDEPTSGLDTMVRREFLESMVDVAATGRTVFLSSHQIAEVERVADIVAILREGQLVLVERLEDLKSQIRELTMTLRDGVARPPGMPLPVLSERFRDRQWQVLARGISDEQLVGLRNHEAISSITSRTPSLEEIFVAHMRAGATAAHEAEAQS